MIKLFSVKVKTVQCKYALCQTYLKCMTKLGDLKGLNRQTYPRSEKSQLSAEMKCGFSEI